MFPEGAAAPERIRAAFHGGEWSATVLLEDGRRGFGVSKTTGAAGFGEALARALEDAGDAARPSRDPTDERWSRWTQHQAICDCPGPPLRPGEEGPRCRLGQALYDSYWRSFMGETDEAREKLEAAR
jgi:hypothetical protein